MASEQKLATAALSIAGLAVGLGLAVAGHQMGEAVRAFRAADRYVTVKGLSERRVTADRATWGIYFNTTAQDFDALQIEVDRSLDSVRGFLRDRGLADETLSVEQTVVTDHHANPYTMQHGGPRYTARCGVTVKTAEVARVAAAAREVNLLVRKGLLLEPGRPIYAFTALNGIKPEMLAEATANARVAAGEFARASQGTVGSMRKANQGAFSIAGDADSGSEGEGEGAFSIDKTVRVVTSVEFFLE